jgi:hypothetical protein
MLVSKHHHLTDELLAKVNPPKSGELRIWDNAFKGFLARVWPSGKVSFCVRYRRGNTAELYTIGTFLSPWTADQARVKASDVFLRFADSHIPSMISLSVI